MMRVDQKNSMHERHLNEFKKNNKKKDEQIFGRKLGDLEFKEFRTNSELRKHKISAFFFS